MKKIPAISCVFIMLLAIVAVLEAAGSPGTKPAGGFFIGGGFVMSDFAIDADSQRLLDNMLWTKKMRPGFQVGAGYEFALSPNIDIVPAVFYSTAGINIEGGAPAVSIEHSWRSLIFPLEVKISFNGPFISAGPYLGYILSAKYIQASVESDLLKPDAAGHVYTNKVHYGVSLGAGFDFGLGRSVLMIKAAYQLGLSNLYNPDPSIPSTMTTVMKHTAITIFGGVKF